ncbi:flavodoxin family protein [Paenibacillus lutrae]|uniref:Flavodoxin family protein n=1 Tax=Paenibacillus lutrae TaxID=2078573 RepID=A0A7X3FLD0_9BACL|nr:flavodoxin family protein [Paenibacillus lutrae]MVP01889.1 flavodoxin family protein [Paenibacillus lutrae]
MTVAVIYGSTRADGNTEILTRQAVQGLQAEAIYLKDFDIQPIEDQRHAAGGFQDVDDDYLAVLERILPHDTLVFATPIYWYSMSGRMKNFVDRWSQTLRDHRYPAFRSSMAGKKAYVIAVGGDEPLIKGLPMIRQFQLIFDFMGMRMDGYVLGQGNKPGEVLQDQPALAAARLIRNTLKNIEGG